MTIKSLFSKYLFAPLFFIAYIALSVTEFYESRLPQSVELIAQKAGVELEKQEKDVRKKMDELAALSSDSAIKEAVFYSAEMQGERNREANNNIAFFAFYKNSLFAWSDSRISFSQQELDSVLGSRELPYGRAMVLIRLRNGWYEVFKKSNRDYHFYATLLIKNEFAYQNKFLVNSFNSQLKIPAGFGFSSSPGKGSAAVKNGSAQVLFYLTSGASNAGEHFSAGSWLYMFVILLLLFSVYSFSKWLVQKSFLLALAFAAIVVWVRLHYINLRLPHGLYATDFFNPQSYASYSYMNSLGDFLVNVSLVLCFLLVFINRLKHLPPDPRVVRIVYFCLLFIVIGSTFLLNSLVRGLVFNSSINFNTSNVFDLDVYSFVGILIIALIAFIYFILLRSLVYVQRKYNYGMRMVAGVGLLLLVLLVARSAMVGEMVLFAFLYIGLSLFGRSRDGKGFPLFAIITFLFITALYASISIYVYGREKERESRKLLAGKIESDQDRIAEHLFEDVQDKISHDSVLQNYFKDTADVSMLINQRLHRRYFNGYWTKYEIEAYCFDALRQPYTLTLDSSDYYRFQAVVENVGRPTYANDLFFLTNAKGKSMYLARIPLFKSDSSTLGTVFIELEPKLVQAAKGFPELFISDKVVFNKDLANYSYGKYKNRELVNQYGDYAYCFSSSVFPQPKDEFSFVIRDGYSHLLYRQNGDNLIVVSKKEDSVYSMVTSFSYFFAFFSIMLIVFLALKHLIEEKMIISFSLKNRIQLSVISIVIFSATMIGAGTIYYIIKKYDDNQSVRITEQLKSLTVAIENNLGDQLNPDSAITEDVIFRLSRLSNIASADFNWYSKSGDLLFSSQPKIFDQGITSTLISPTAFDELTDKKRTQFVHPENVGRLKYVAAYQTLRNKQNQVLGYISLPYFEKENELKRDVSAFLSALINIYVLLISIAVLVTFFIAARITKPLILIQEKLAAINLGRRNEFIQWNSNDEIGELVKEYNKKVEELAISADMLAKSERESAWQEMAKQVAHEIKNPLTPMKLGVQHLLNAYSNDSPGKEELVKKISQTLIQQIDTLSNIANEFSNFAKMPQTKNEVVNICTVLSDTINLFKESPGVNVTFEKELEKKTAEVYADKDQLIRLFSNLLKNAIQSIPAEREGKVAVKLALKEGFFEVSVMDNGSGIADNQVEKIFTPNFTTKSGGMGLGLAMVKNIVENSGGKVWFKTQIGAGTTFFVTLPALP